jgi:hypothetical protein
MYYRARDNAVEIAGTEWRQAMGVVRIFGLGVGFTAALGVATACGSSENSSSSSSSAKSSSTSTASSSSAAASTTSSVPPSGVAPLADYTYLLLHASDVGTNATTTGPPMQNPGGVAGAAVTFGNSDRTRTIDDLVVFTDPTVAAEQTKERTQSFGKYVTAAPQPFEVGTNGLIAVGLSPDNSKAVLSSTGERITGTRIVGRYPQKIGSAPLSR